jgi:UDP-glucose 4-epimerase
MRTLVEDALGGRTTMVRDAPRRTRQHIFVDDVVDAVCAALDATTLTQRAYNVGPGIAQQLDDIVEGVRSAVPAASVTLRADGLSWNTFGLGPLAIDAAGRDLSFTPRVSLAEGAKRTRAWLEEGRVA